MTNPKKTKYPKPAGFDPEPTFDKKHRHASKPRCQAWKPNLGRQCGQMPMKLIAGGHPADPENYSTVCRLDGGKSPRGIDHYNYQGKGYSRYVPGPMEPAITAFLESGDPLDLIQAIATWEGRIDGLLRSLEGSGDPIGAWGELAEHWEDMGEAAVAKDLEKVSIHREAIGAILKSGMAQAETWKQIREADETRRKLIDSEDKKRDRRRGWMRAEEIRYQNNALRLAVVEAMALIEDPKLQRKVRTFIAERFIQVVGPAALPGPATADRED